MSRHPDIRQTDIRVGLTVAGRCWLLASAGLALVGIYKNINLILLIAYFLVTLLIFNWWKVRHTLTGIMPTLEPLSDGFAGQPRTIHCVATNQGRRASRGTQVIISVADQTCSWYLAQIKPRESMTLNQTVSISKRGVFPMGELRLKNSFPFGLVEASTQFPGTRSFASYPRRGEIELVRLLRLLTNDTIPHSSHRTAVRQLTEGTDIHGLRPFRAGDSPRWIHWRTTARVGELMVREFDRASGPRLSVVIVPPDSKSSPIESSLELAATMIWEWSRRQDGRLSLWIPILGQWQSMTLDNRRRADDMLRRLAALSTNELYCNEPVPRPSELKNRSRFVYIKKGRLDSSRFAQESGSICLDPSIASEVYRPPPVAKS